MSKYNKQNRLDEKAVSIISDYFMNKHGDRFDLQFHGIKDNTPDTDGFLRLREPNPNKPMQGEYLNQVVFFQLKGYEKPIQNNTYVCSPKLLKFCKEINLPTILFVVSNINKESEKQKHTEIYWYYFSDTNVEMLDEFNKNNKSNVRISDLNVLKIGKMERIDDFYIRIKNLAIKNYFLDLPKEILTLVLDSRDKILNVASILYLIGKASKSERKIIAKILKITNKQLDDILSGLHKQKLVYKNKDVVIFTSVQDEFKREVGLLLLYEAISKIEHEIGLDNLVKLFPEHKQKIQIYNNLSKARHPLIFNYFKKQADNFFKHVKVKR